MNQGTKEIIQYTSAIGMLLFGASLSVAGFCVSPIGVIDDSILWCLGQSLLYAGGVFGIGVYVDGRINQEMKKLKQKINKDGSNE